MTRACNTYYNPTKENEDKTIKKLFLITFLLLPLSMLSAQQKIDPVTEPVPDGYVLIEGGSFMMGSPSGEPGRYDDEVQHRVTVSSFYMKETEVTQSQWRLVMGNNPSYFKGDDRPVELITWFEALEYCNALSRREGLTPVYRSILGEQLETQLPSGLVINEGRILGDVTADWTANGYRLPTEAEWEYAARAGSKTAIYTGNITIKGINNAPELDRIAWYGGNSGYGYPYSTGYDSSEWTETQYTVSRSGTRTVGEKMPNGYGLYDILGNVWEWCWDWYGDYPTVRQTDPVGPSGGSYRVFRGGSWIIGARYLRSAYRSYSTPSSRDDSLGLRPVRSVRTR